jgi:hypothetical protein
MWPSKDAGPLLQPPVHLILDCREAIQMQAMCVFFAYFGPETVMPMTSVLATAAAVVMMFGRTILRFTIGWFRAVWYRRHRRKSTPAPHFAVGRGQSDGIKDGLPAYASQAEQ